MAITTTEVTTATTGAVTMTATAVTTEVTTATTEVTTATTEVTTATTATTGAVTMTATATTEVTTATTEVTTATTATTATEVAMAEPSFAEALEQFDFKNYLRRLIDTTPKSTKENKKPLTSISTKSIEVNGIDCDIDIDTNKNKAVGKMVNRETTLYVKPGTGNVFNIFKSRKGYYKQDVVALIKAKSKNTTEALAFMKNKMTTSNVIAMLETTQDATLIAAGLTYLQKYYVVFGEKPIAPKSPTKHKTPKAPASGAKSLLSDGTPTPQGPQTPQGSQTPEKVKKDKKPFHNKFEFIVKKCKGKGKGRTKCHAFASTFVNKMRALLNAVFGLTLAPIDATTNNADTSVAILAESEVDTAEISADTVVEATETDNGTGTATHEGAQNDVAHNTEKALSELCDDATVVSDNSRNSHAISEALANYIYEGRNVDAEILFNTENRETFITHHKVKRNATYKKGIFFGAYGLHIDVCAKRSKEVFFVLAIHEATHAKFPEVTDEKEIIRKTAEFIFSLKEQNDLLQKFGFGEDVTGLRILQKVYGTEDRGAKTIADYAVKLFTEQVIETQSAGSINETDADQTDSMGTTEQLDVPVTCSDLDEPADEIVNDLTDNVESVINDIEKTEADSEVSAAGQGYKSNSWISSIQAKRVIERKGDEMIHHVIHSSAVSAPSGAIIDVVPTTLQGDGPTFIKAVAQHLSELVGYNVTVHTGSKGKATFAYAQNDMSTSINVDMYHMVSEATYVVNGNHYALGVGILHIAPGLYRNEFGDITLVVSPYESYNVYMDDKGLFVLVDGTEIYLSDVLKTASETDKTVSALSVKCAKIAKAISHTDISAVAQLKNRADGTIVKTATAKLFAMFVYDQINGFNDGAYKAFINFMKVNKFDAYIDGASPFARDVANAQVFAIVDNAQGARIVVDRTTPLHNFINHYLFQEGTNIGEKEVDVKCLSHLYMAFFRHTLALRIAIGGKGFGQQLNLVDADPIRLLANKTVAWDALRKYALRANVSGTVTSVTVLSIVIGDNTYTLQNPYNTGSISYTPVVKVGDKVSKGDVIALDTRTAVKRDNKIMLSLGTKELNTVILLNSRASEDSGLIRESAVRELRHKEVLDVLFTTDEANVTAVVVALRNKFRNAFIVSDGLIKAHGGILEVELANGDVVKIHTNDIHEFYGINADAKDGKIEVRCVSVRAIQTGDKIMDPYGGKCTLTVVSDGDFDRLFGVKGFKADLAVSSASLTTRNVFGKLIESQVNHVLYAMEKADEAELSVALSTVVDADSRALLDTAVAAGFVDYNTDLTSSRWVKFVNSADYRNVMSLLTGVVYTEDNLAMLEITSELNLTDYKGLGVIIGRTNVNVLHHEADHKYNPKNSQTGTDLTYGNDGQKVSMAELFNVIHQPAILRELIKSSNDFMSLIHCIGSDPKNNAYEDFVAILVTMGCNDHVNVQHSDLFLNAEQMGLYKALIELPAVQVGETAYLSKVSIETKVNTLAYETQLANAYVRKLNSTSTVYHAVAFTKLVLATMQVYKTNKSLALYGADALINSLFDASHSEDLHVMLAELTKQTNVQTSTGASVSSMLSSLGVHNDISSAIEVALGYMPVGFASTSEDGTEVKTSKKAVYGTDGSFVTITNTALDYKDEGTGERKPIAGGFLSHGKAIGEIPTTFVVPKLASFGTYGEHIVRAHGLGGYKAVKEYLGSLDAVASEMRVRILPASFFEQMFDADGNAYANDFYPAFKDIAELAFVLNSIDHETNALMFDALYGLLLKEMANLVSNGSYTKKDPDGVNLVDHSKKGLIRAFVMSFRTMYTVRGVASIGKPHQHPDFVGGSVLTFATAFEPLIRREVSDEAALQALKAKYANLEAYKTPMDFHNTFSQFLTDAANPAGENMWTFLKAFIEREIVSRGYRVQLTRSPFIWAKGVVALRPMITDKSFREQDKTISIHMAIVKILNADFDGDTVLIRGFSTPEAQEELARNMSPHALLLDRVLKGADSERGKLMFMPSLEILLGFKLAEKYGYVNVDSLFMTEQARAEIKAFHGMSVLESIQAILRSSETVFDLGTLHKPLRAHAAEISATGVQGEAFFDAIHHIYVIVGALVDSLGVTVSMKYLAELRTTDLLDKFKSSKNASVSVMDTVAKQIEADAQAYIPTALWYNKKAIKGDAKQAVRAMFGRWVTNPFSGQDYCVGNFYDGLSDSDGIVEAALARGETYQSKVAMGIIGDPFHHINKLALRCIATDLADGKIMEVRDGDPYIYVSRAFVAEVKGIDVQDVEDRSCVGTDVSSIISNVMQQATISQGKGKSDMDSDKLPAFKDILSLCFLRPETDALNAEVLSLLSDAIKVLHKLHLTDVHNLVATFNSFTYEHKVDIIAHMFTGLFGNEHGFFDPMRAYKLFTIAVMTSVETKDLVSAFSISINEDWLGQFVVGKTHACLNRVPDMSKELPKSYLQPILGKTTGITVTRLPASVAPTFEPLLGNDVPKAYMRKTREKANVYTAFAFAVGHSGLLTYAYVQKVGTVSELQKTCSENFVWVLGECRDIEHAYAYMQDKKANAQANNVNGPVVHGFVLPVTQTQNQHITTTLRVNGLHLLANGQMEGDLSQAEIATLVESTDREGNTATDYSSSEAIAFGKTEIVVFNKPLTQKEVVGEPHSSVNHATTAKKYCLVAFLSKTVNMRRTYTAPTALVGDLCSINDPFATVYTSSVGVCSADINTPLGAIKYLADAVRFAAKASTTSGEPMCYTLPAGLLFTSAVQMKRFYKAFIVNCIHEYLPTQGRHATKNSTEGTILTDDGITSVYPGATTHNATVGIRLLGKKHIGEVFCNNAEAIAVWNTHKENLHVIVRDIFGDTYSEETISSVCKALCVNGHAVDLLAAYNVSVKTLHDMLASAVVSGTNVTYTVPKTTVVMFKSVDSTHYSDEPLLSLSSIAEINTLVGKFTAALCTEPMIERLSKIKAQTIELSNVRYDQLKAIVTALETLPHGAILATAGSINPALTNKKLLGKLIGEMDATDVPAIRDYISQLELRYLMRQTDMVTSVLARELSEAFMPALSNSSRTEAFNYALWTTFMAVLSQLMITKNEFGKSIDNALAIVKTHKIRSVSDVSAILRDAIGTPALLGSAIQCLPCTRTEVKGAVGPVFYGLKAKDPLADLGATTSVLTCASLTSVVSLLVYNNTDFKGNAITPKLEANGQVSEYHLKEAALKKAKYVVYSDGYAALQNEIANSWVKDDIVNFVFVGNDTTPDAVHAFGSFPVTNGEVLEKVLTATTRLSPQGKARIIATNDYIGHTIAYYADVINAFGVDVTFIETAKSAEDYFSVGYKRLFRDQHTFAEHVMSGSVGNTLRLSNYSNLSCVETVTVSSRNADTDFTFGMQPDTSDDNANRMLINGGMGLLRFTVDSTIAVSTNGKTASSTIGDLCNLISTTLCRSARGVRATIGVMVDTNAFVYRLVTDKFVSDADGDITGIDVMGDVIVTVSGIVNDTNVVTHFYLHEVLKHLSTGSVDLFNDTEHVLQVVRVTTNSVRIEPSTPTRIDYLPSVFIQKALLDYVDFVVPISRTQKARSSVNYIHALAMTAGKLAVVDANNGITTLNTASSGIDLIDVYTKHVPMVYTQVRAGVTELVTVRLDTRNAKVTPLVAVGASTAIVKAGVDTGTSIYVRSRTKQFVTLDLASGGVVTHTMIVPANVLYSTLRAHGVKLSGGDLSVESFVSVFGPISNRYGFKSNETISIENECFLVERVERVIKRNQSKVVVCTIYGRNGTRFVEYKETHTYDVTAFVGAPTISEQRTLVASIDAGSLYLAAADRALHMYKSAYVIVPMNDLLVKDASFPTYDVTTKTTVHNKGLANEFRTYTPYDYRIKAVRVNIESPMHKGYKVVSAYKAKLDASVRVEHMFELICSDGTPSKAYLVLHSDQKTANLCRLLSLNGAQPTRSGGNLTGSNATIGKSRELLLGLFGKYAVKQTQVDVGGETVNILSI